MLRGDDLLADTFALIDRSSSSFSPAPWSPNEAQCALSPLGWIEAHQAPRLMARSSSCIMSPAVMAG